MPLFPWLDMPAAGLTSAGIQKSCARGTPVDASRDYYPSGVLPHRPTWYTSYESPPSLRTSDIDGAKPKRYGVVTWGPRSQVNLCSGSHLVPANTCMSKVCMGTCLIVYQGLQLVLMCDSCHHTVPYMHSSLNEQIFTTVFLSRFLPLRTSETETTLPNLTCAVLFKPPSLRPSCMLRDTRTYRTRPSTSLDTSDIQGARPLTSTTVHHGGWAKFTDRTYVYDITVSWLCPKQAMLFNGTDMCELTCALWRQQGQQSLRSSEQQRNSSSLTTADIKGASAPRGTRSEILSPGRGTLVCSDISGSSVGNIKASRSTVFSSTCMLGRHPAPSTFKFEFGQQPRRTAINKPMPSAD